jgi:hypothetical protein
MEKEINALPGYVRMDIGRGELAGMLAAYRELAVLCLEQGAKAALIASAAGDATTPMGLRAALTAMSRLGLDHSFRLALVARGSEAQKTYRTAQSGAWGMKVKVFRNEYEAAAWLMGARQRRA